MATLRPHYSAWRETENLVFVSGQLAFDETGIVGETIGEQTAKCLENLLNILSKAGLSLDDVVKTTAWLQDARDFGGFNQVYGSYFPKEPPARSTAESRLMIDIKVEIEAIAYSPKK